jgi:uncharacterized membrane protein
MTPLVRELLLLAHLLGVVVWVGGMAFAYYSLRPAAMQTLQPPQRLPLWSATLGRFLRHAGVAVVAVVASGLVMLMETGFRNAPLGWHAMLALGLVMALIYGVVAFVHFPRLRDRCRASAFGEAANALDGIRRLVALNLVLGFCTIAAAVQAR